LARALEAGGRRQEAGGSPDEKIFHHQIMKLGALLFPVPYFQVRRVGATTKAQRTRRMILYLQ